MYFQEWVRLFECAQRVAFDLASHLAHFNLLLIEKYLAICFSVFQNLHPF